MKDNIKTFYELGEAVKELYKNESRIHFKKYKSRENHIFCRSAYKRVNFDISYYTSNNTEPYYTLNFGDLGLKWSHEDEYYTEYHTEIVHELSPNIIFKALEKGYNKIKEI